MSAPNLRARKVHRWFQQRIAWPLLDLRDWLLRRDRTKPLYEEQRPSRVMRLRWRLLDAWDRSALSRHMPRFGGQHRRRAGAVAFVALPVAVAAALGLAALGSDSGRPSTAPATAKEPPAQVVVAGVEASSTDAAAADRERADRAARRQRAADRRQRAADRRHRAVRRDRAAARRHRAAARKRAARRKHSHRSSPAPVRTTTPPATVVSSPAPQPAAPSAPPRPHAPSRQPSSGGGGGGSSQPSPGVKFDDAG
jgi:hypothetical protein